MARLSGGGCPGEGRGMAIGYWIIFFVEGLTNPLVALASVAAGLLTLSWQGRLLRDLPDTGCDLRSPSQARVC